MLSRSFDGAPAVEDLSLEIPEGSLFTLLGPNGAGKTTTVRLLLGLIGADRGSAVVAGYEVGRDPQTNRMIRAAAGLLTETPGFYDRLTAWANLVFFARLYEIPEATLTERIERYLRQMDLWERREDPVGSFSKGMKQKLAIIRAVFHEPKVIFLDEPTAGLDPEASLMVRDMIARLKTQGRTIVMCTHNLDEAERLSDLVGIINRRLLVCAPLVELQQMSAAEVEIELDNHEDIDREEKFRQLLDGLSEVQKVSVDRNVYTVGLRDAPAQTPGLVRELVGAGAEILAVRPRRRDLQSIYLECVREKGGRS